MGNETCCTNSTTLKLRSELDLSQSTYRQSKRTQAYKFSDPLLSNNQYRYTLYEKEKLLLPALIPVDSTFDTSLPSLASLDWLLSRLTSRCSPPPEQKSLAHGPPSPAPSPIALPPSPRALPAESTPPGLVFGHFSTPEYKYTGHYFQLQKPVPHGYGLLDFSNHAKFYGEFKYGAPNGYGVYHYPRSSHVYLGQWENGAMHGEGQIRYPDGALVKGRFERGKLEGEAEVWSPEIGDWVAEWKRGVRVRNEWQPGADKLCSVQEIVDEDESPD